MNGEKSFDRDMTDNELSLQDRFVSCLRADAPMYCPSLLLAEPMSQTTTESDPSRSEFNYSSCFEPIINHFPQTPFDEKDRLLSHARFVQNTPLDRNSLTPDPHSFLDLQQSYISPISKGCPALCTSLTVSPNSPVDLKLFPLSHRQEPKPYNCNGNGKCSVPSAVSLPGSQAHSVDGFIYQVHFKRAHRNFLLASSAPRDLQLGDFVKVEADRGEDLGVLVAKVPISSFQEPVPTAGYRGRGYSSGPSEKKLILRRASLKERGQLIEKVRDEEKTLEVIREKISERALPMTILDAEYQFDRHKLIFFFEADRRIDFRELVSDLFSLYKTRIWMQQVDTSSLPDQELRTKIARSAGLLPSSYSPEEFEELDRRRSSHHLQQLPHSVPAPTRKSTKAAMFDSELAEQDLFSQKHNERNGKSRFFPDVGTPDLPAGVKMSLDRASWNAPLNLNSHWE